MITFDNSQKETIQEAAKELDIPIEIITAVYYSQWGCIKSKIQELELFNPTLTEEEFNKIKGSFNLPSIGKLYPSWKTIHGLRVFKEIKKNNKK